MPARRAAIHAAPKPWNAAAASGPSQGRAPWIKSESQKWNGAAPSSTRPASSVSGSAVFHRNGGSSPSCSTPHCSTTTGVPVAIVSSVPPAHDSASAGTMSHRSLMPHSLWSRSRRLRASAAITSPISSGAQIVGSDGVLATIRGIGTSTSGGSMVPKRMAPRRSSASIRSATSSAAIVGPSGVAKAASTR